MSAPPADKVIVYNMFAPVIRELSATSHKVFSPVVVQVEYCVPLIVNEKPRVAPFTSFVLKKLTV